MSIAGKTVLITGAARRIGAHVARTLHENGANLIIHYNRSEKVARQLVDALNRARDRSAVSLQADLNFFDQITRLANEAIAQFGSLDVLINNASSYYPTPVGAIKPEHWDDLMNSNCRAPLFLSQAFHSTLSQKQGAIINMLDVYAETPLKHHSVYCAAKSASQMLVKSLALDFAPDIRVNGIAPGAILWPDHHGADDTKTQQAIIDKIPLQRCGDPDVIARTVLFILDNDYLTGEIIHVDGGRLLNSS